MALKLYYDLMSQPSRTLYILLKKANYEFESKPIALRKGEHFSDEFTKVNRIQRVPVIDHDGFVLTESVAIVKYLARQKIIPESLYPEDTQKQARVEEFLEWHHIGLRLHCAMYFRAKVLEPSFGKINDESTLAGYKKRMVQGLEIFDTKWLGRGTAFIVGDTITVADLFAATELEQPTMAGYDPKTHFPAIATWWDKVQEYFNPYYDEAHVIVKEFRRNQEKMGDMNSKL